MQLLSVKELVLMYHLLNASWASKSKFIPSDLEEALERTDHDMWREVRNELNDRGVNPFHPEF